MNTEPDPNHNNTHNDQTNADGWTLLHHAVKEGRKEVVAFLLVHGAGVNTATDSGDTALHFAATKNYCPSVRILLAHGADPNIKNRDGKTPLDVATVEVADIIRQFILTHYQQHRQGTK